jgi:aspartate aminotransferase
MAKLEVSKRTLSAAEAMQRPMRFIYETGYLDHATDPEVCNFVFGNPHEMPLKGFTSALQKWSVPQNKDWFAYKLSEPHAQRAVAADVGAHRGLTFEPSDICLTNGGFAALSVAINTVVDAGDEVIFMTPPWFFYEGIIAKVGGVSVKVSVRADNFDLDLSAIERAITPKTRAIIVNSPNNPTGKIYPVETLKGLADLLRRASERNGRRIYLLSDEAYSRILFDGRECPSAVSYYADSFFIYTYGKTLLTPGERIGYITPSPLMPAEERAELVQMLFVNQAALGYLFPNGLLQHAIEDLNRLSIDIGHLQEKRDYMVSSLREMGYEVHSPEATFYLLPKSPIPDDAAFCRRLAEHKVLCLPGQVVELPGYFRISLTANDDMIKRAMAGFDAAVR